MTDLRPLRCTQPYEWSPRLSCARHQKGCLIRNAPPTRHTTLASTPTCGRAACPGGARARRQPQPKPPAPAPLPASHCGGAHDGPRCAVHCRALAWRALRQASCKAHLQWWQCTPQPILLPLLPARPACSSPSLPQARQPATKTWWPACAAAASSRGVCVCGCRQAHTAGTARPLASFSRMPCALPAPVPPPSTLEPLRPRPFPPCCRRSDRVARALRLCARDLFVPAQHAEEALVDAPIRVDALDFNISAPHMWVGCGEGALGRWAVGEARQVGFVQRLIMHGDCNIHAGFGAQWSKGTSRSQHLSRSPPPAPAPPHPPIYTRHATCLEALKLEPGHRVMMHACSLRRA